MSGASDTPEVIQERELGSRCCPPLSARTLDGAAAKSLADLLQLLGHPVRLQLLDILSRQGGQVCVCDLEEALPIKQPTISHHLRILREAGLIDFERHGPWIYHFVLPEALAAARSGIGCALSALSAKRSPETSSRIGAEMSTEHEDVVRDAVRERYAGVATSASSCCSPSSGCGCTASDAAAAPDETEISRRLGYSEEELAAAPVGANLGLGCGNPQAIAELSPGEVVLDLGSGAGFDCFLAARRLGDGGRVIGVDMTPEMVAKARENARSAGYSNTEFRLGEIEHLPVADGSVDVIMSNCVINLSPDKPAVFREAFRVLKPGGRLAISDVVATAPLPESVRDDMRLLSACISGAADLVTLEAILADAGFQDVDIQPVEDSREFIRDWEPGSRLEDFVLSATIRAVKR